MKIETMIFPFGFTGYNWLWLQSSRQENREGVDARELEKKEKNQIEILKKQIFWCWNFDNFEQVGGRAECANEGNYGNENGNSTREAHRGFVQGLNLQLMKWRGGGNLGFVYNWSQEQKMHIVEWVEGILFKFWPPLTQMIFEKNISQNINLNRAVFPLTRLEPGMFRDIWWITSQHNCSNTVPRGLYWYAHQGRQLHIQLGNWHPRELGYAVSWETDNLF